MPSVKEFSVSVALAVLMCLGAGQINADTLFTAIDMSSVALPTAPSRGIEPVPWIVGYDMHTRSSRALFFTLDPATGAQLGNRLVVDLPVLHYAVDILCGRHFSSSISRGIEPSPWIVFSDYGLYNFSIGYNPDGTPVAGTPLAISLAVNHDTYGNPTCLAELPGTEFTDGKPRLFIGTDKGFVVVVMNTYAAGIMVVGYIEVSSDPITDLEPIPQYSYIALGAVTGSVIVGIQYQPGPEKSGPAAYAFPFVMADTLPNPMIHFDTFGPHDARASNMTTPVRLVLANGSDELGLVSISPVQAGRVYLDPLSDPLPIPVSSAVTGSLLMLLADGSAVTFDPDYSPDTGFSGCDVNVTDIVADVCGYICGDANGDGVINVGDAVHIINYVFKGGVAPEPLGAGDANCDGVINVGDAVHIINYVFKDGAEPCCP